MTTKGQRSVALKLFLIALSFTPTNSSSGNSFDSSSNIYLTIPLPLSPPWSEPLSLAFIIGISLCFLPPPTPQSIHTTAEKSFKILSQVMSLCSKPCMILCCRSLQANLRVLPLIRLTLIFCFLFLSVQSLGPSLQFLEHFCLEQVSYRHVLD